MEKVRILMVCTHPEILQTVVRLINNNPEWIGIGAETEKEALDLFIKNPFNLVLLGSGMDNLSETRLRPILSAYFADVKFIQHYGGGSGLLFAEIFQALTTN